MASSDKKMPFEVYVCEVRFVSLLFKALNILPKVATNLKL